MFKSLLSIALALGTTKADTWANYSAGNMDVLSVTGGADGADYSKVVIMLHGGGMKGSDWRSQYDSGWFGDITGYKFVFPTATFENPYSKPGYPGYLWYKSIKAAGCSFCDDCSYDLSSITTSAENIA